MNWKRCGFIAAVVGGFFFIANSAPAQGTAFTYQGRLQSNGSPASGIYNLTFTLYDVSTGGSSVAGPVTNNAVNITNGLFTVMVDFGSTVWNGQTNWLQVGVETNGATSPFTPLLPRQQLTPAPYAIYSETASNLTGPVSLAQLPGAVITNNEANVTFNNAIVGGLILSNSATIYDNYAGSRLYPLFFVDAQDNVFLGFAGNQTTANLGGAENEGAGVYALSRNTTGSDNVANGFYAMYSNTAGSENVAEGAAALQVATNESGTVAIGSEALQNDNAFNNGYTASGYGENTAVGYQALTSDTIGAANTAIGYQSLLNNINGNANIAIGDGAMGGNLFGSQNTVVGYLALTNTTGFGNTALGAYALEVNYNDSDNTAVGYSALYNCTNGSENIAIGTDAGYLLLSGGNNIYIGNGGNPTDNTTIRIGTQGTHTATIIAGIYGGILPSGETSAPVVIDSGGHLAAATGASFSPTIGDGAHNFAMSNQTGYYTKIGNLVYFEIWLQWTGKGSAVAADNVEISLPIAVTSARVSIPLGFVSGVSFDSQLTAGANLGSSSLLLYSLSNTGGTPADVSVSKCGNSGEIQISGAYRWQ